MTEYIGITSAAPLLALLTTAVMGELNNIVNTGVAKFEVDFDKTFSYKFFEERRSVTAS